MEENKPNLKEMLEHLHRLLHMDEAIGLVEKEECIYKEKGCNKIKEDCKRESCAYAKYFDWLGENFGPGRK